MTPEVPCYHGLENTWLFSLAMCVIRSQDEVPIYLWETHEFIDT